MSPNRRPLFDFWPRLEPELGFSPLGDFPTPVEPLSRLVPGLEGWGETFVKRDDLSSPVYGGNKVRTLEPLFGQALREGRKSVFATGAYGSNHAVATVLHAPRAGLRSGVMLFPQPYSEAARVNLRVSATYADEVVNLLHWSLLPFAIWRLARGRRGTDAAPLIMPPGGAIPRGCLGFLSGALELAEQIDAGLLPAPEEVVLALGSTCSSAGLLVGLRVAARMGLGFERGAPPLLVAVRVTPWPVTSPWRIVHLAGRVAGWLHQLTADPLFHIERAELARGLEVDGAHLGRGYGRPTDAGRRVISRLRPFSAALDTTYSAKSAAALYDRVAQRPACPRVFWSTKSGAALPEVSSERLARAPARVLRWLERGQKLLPADAAG
jgi:D-cysteine desulfhydrase